MKSLPDKKIIYPALLAAVLTFLVYLPSLRYDFVSWDDGMYVLYNSHIRNMDLDFFKWAFTTPYLANWHPLTFISYALDYRIGGLNPFIYHFENVVFHAINTFLVSVLTVRLLNIMALKGRKDAEPGPGVSKTLSFTAPFVAALFFGLHPLHVESVTWVSERKDVLSTFFFLLSVLAYLRYSTGPAVKKASNYIGALVFFILALMSKPMAISLPVVLLLLDYYPIGKIVRLRQQLGELKWVILEKIPFVVLSVLSAMLTVWAQKRAGALVPSETLPLPPRLLIAAKTYVFYLYKTVLPVDLAPFYPYPGRIDLFRFEFFGPLLFLLAVTLFSLLAVRRYRFFLAVWVTYLITLFPVIGVVQVGSQSAADRYMYLPSLPLFIFAGILAGYLFDRMTRSPGGEAASGYFRNPRLAAAFALAVVLFSTLSYLTVKQEGIWKETITFWTHELKIFPDSYKAHLHRGQFYVLLGETGKAIEDYKTAMSLLPNAAEPYNEVGILYGGLGKYKEAFAAFDEAIKLEPDYDKAYNNRGYTHFQAGDFKKAVEDINMAISLNPGNIGAYYNISSAYSELGDTEQARIHIEIAEKLKAR